MPTPEDLRMIGKAFKDRGITAHFDVGDIVLRITRSVWCSTSTGRTTIRRKLPTTIRRHLPMMVPGAKRLRAGRRIHQGDAVSGRKRATGLSPGLALPVPSLPGHGAGESVAGDYATHRLPTTAGQLAPADDISAWFDWAMPRRALRPGASRPVPLPAGRLTRARNRNLQDPSPTSTCPRACRAEQNCLVAPLLVTMGMWTDFVGRPFARAGHHLP